MRFCAPGKSKKPPQLGEFLGCGYQLGFDRVEHGAGIYGETAVCPAEFPKLNASRIAQTARIESTGGKILTR
jgi:hypothetical protein